MEVKLAGLIEKIKKEGVGQAQARAQEIEDKARAQAQRIIEEAQQEAARLMAAAKQEADKLKENTAVALNHAARDLSLTVKAELLEIFAAILKDGVDKALDAEFLKKLLLKVVERWAPDKDTPLEVCLGEDDKKQLSAQIFAEVKKRAKSNIEIKFDRNIDKGFRIGIKGEALSYDFTDESILESFKAFLNPVQRAVLHTK